VVTIGTVHFNITSSAFVQKV